MVPFSLRRGAHLAYHGHPCVFQGLAANGRCQFADGEGWMLEVTDEESGLPVWPTPAQVLDLMADERLILRADPLDDPIRRRARAEEPTRRELAEARCRSVPDRTRDPWFHFREDTLQAWDDPDVERCALTRTAIPEWYERNFDVAELRRRYGRLPSDRTFRRWIAERGRSGDRRPADFASLSGLGRRRRRIDPIVLGIIRKWVELFHAKPRQSINAFWKRVTEDVGRYGRGEALEILGFERALDPPRDPASARMCTRRIFTMEIERARGGAAMAVAYGQRAREQRFGGGGVSQEPVRFLQVVQLDDTPFPMVFVFDAVRSIPVGVPIVTIAIDVYTRVILGWDITFEAPSYASYMRTMLHTALPKRVPESFRKDPLLANRLAELCGRVVGHMLLDNARHQIGRAAQDAGGDIGSGVRWAGKKQPTHKPHVESCIETLQMILRDLLPAATWDIPLMREFDYDPNRQAIVTLERFREIFAEVVARYHTTEHTGLLNRWPLDVWTEQRLKHGLEWVSDPDHFRRAIADVDFLSFRGDGVRIEGLRYGSDGSDDRWPVSNEDILFNLGMARGVASDTKKRSFAKVKVKYDPNNMAVAWLFDEHRREYVEIPCTMRRYAENLPLWLHSRLKEYAREKRLAFESEHDMLAVRDAYARMISRIVPEAFAAERRAAARLGDSTQGRAYAGDSVELLAVAPSPSGMESIVRHEDRIASRRDATREAPRSDGRSRKPDGPNATAPRPAPSAGPLREDVAQIARRMDLDDDDQPYS